MVLNRYLFSVALFANIFLNVTSFDYKCVSESYGTLEGEQVLDFQVATPPNVINIPQVCSKYVGLSAEVCSYEDENVKAVVPNLNKVFVSSDKLATVSLKLYCNDDPSTVQNQAKPKVAKVQQAVAPVKEPKVKEAEPIEAKVIEAVAPVQVASVLEGVARVKVGANRAQANVNRVKLGAARAQLNVDKAQEGVDKAQRGVAKALASGGKAQLRVYKAEHSISKAQRRIYKAQRRINNAQKRANKAQHDVEKAQKRAAKAQKRVGYVDYYY